MEEKAFSSLTANLDYPTPAEAQDAAPVAGGVDSTPTNWFELGAELCASGHLTETRLRRAFAAVKAVQK